MREQILLSTFLEDTGMKEHVMKLDYAKTFKRIIVLFILLAVVTAVAIPLSLSQQISDAAALKQEYALAKQNAADTVTDSATDNVGDKQDGEHDHEHDRDREEDMWKSRITPLNAVNYAIIGGLSVLWAVLAVYYWLAVIAWLYKSAVNEKMNKSLWPILGIFFNIFAVMAFCIVRDRPEKA